jgi:hypothetical protein
MNYRRGLFRAWLVVSILWIGFFGVAGARAYRSARRSRAAGDVFYGIAQGCINREMEANAHPGPFADPQFWEARVKENFDQAGQMYQASQEHKDQFHQAAILGPVGPITLLVLYLLVVYVAKGFEQKES